MLPLSAALLAFVSILYPFFTPSYTRMVDRVSASIVRVGGRGPDGAQTCSGEVIAPNRILTAAHCVEPFLWVDKLPAKALKIDLLYDLALLEAKTSKPPIQFRDRPVVRFEKLTAIGYAWGSLYPSVLMVHVIRLDISPWASSKGGMLDDATPTGGAQGIIVQTEYIGGMSGGPVVDKDGLQVSIVQQGGEGAGFGVGVLLIRAFLLGTH